MFIMGATAISLSLIFPFLSHPVSYISVVIFQTLMSALFSSFYQKSFWFGYILFLIFLGGMLVLFSYITTLAANELFKFSPFLILLMTISMMFSYTYLCTSNFFESPSLFSITLSVTKFYSQNYLTSIIIILYLLITLLVVVKISSFKQGPLRSTI